MKATSLVPAATARPLPASSARWTRRQFARSAAVVGSLAAVAPRAWVQAAASGPIPMAFVGCAHIHTPGFIQLLKGRSDVRVKSTWDPDAARAQKRAAELGARAVADVREVWSDPEIVAVVICSETHRHAELVAGAAKARKHLFVEKPLGITAKESEVMAQQIEKAGLLFTTGYFMRTDPKHLFLKEQVAAGSFGRITRAAGWNCHSGSLGGWFDTEWRWMADPKLAGVGAFGDLGTHSLDILMWILGEVDSATADIQAVTGRYGNCDEYGVGLMKFKSGVTGTLTAGWLDVANPLTLTLAGTEGHAHILNDELFFQSKKVEGADGKQPWRKLPQAPALPLHQFVDAVAGRKEGTALVTPREAAARVAVMEALYEGARARKWIAVR